MTRFFRISILACLLQISLQANSQNDYSFYHDEIIRIEELLIEGRFSEAINSYSELFDQFDFIFKRDLVVAAQCAAYEGLEKEAIEFTRMSLAFGAEFQEISKIPWLKIICGNLKQGEIDSLKVIKHYENDSLRQVVYDLYKKDQKMAIKSMFRIGSNSKTKYNERKFAPHSEEQLRVLTGIIKDHGYPGERLIGNDYWASTILSHHNSISMDYNKNDTLYLKVRPFLNDALKRGEISPFEYALIESWRITTVTEPDQVSYGFIGPKVKCGGEFCNKKRSEIHMRSIQNRNALVDLQEETGIDFMLPGKPWVSGKIKYEHWSPRCL